MNKIKDFIYDKNDLLIALLIVVAATFVIMSRIDVIMAYPATFAAETGANGNGVIAQVPNEPTDPTPSPDGEEPVGSTGEQEDPPPESNNGGGANAGSGEPITGEPSVSQVSVRIEYGATGSDIAQLLINAGLITSKEVFYDAVAVAGAETKLQAGSFSIPSNATPAEIIKIITN